MICAKVQCEHLCTQNASPAKSVKQGPEKLPDKRVGQKNVTYLNDKSQRTRKKYFYKKETIRQ